MNCKTIEELLIDYIDGELSDEENNQIKDHFDNCSKCQKEYEELKSSIDYLTIKSNTIDTTKDIKLNTNIIIRKSVKRITRTGLIAIALSLILIVSAVATDLFGFMEYWKESSEITKNAWEELIENGIGQKLDISTTDKDIKITAEGVISDELNTIILLKIEDLKGNNKYTPPKRTGNVADQPSSILLGGDLSHEELWGDSMLIMSELEPLYSEVYSEDENTIKLMIWTNPLNKEKGNIDINIGNMQVFTSPLPYINENEKISGNWNLSIPVEVVQSKTYEVNKKMDMDGQEVDIKQIVVAPTATSIQYGLNPYNKEKDYYISNISFLIKLGNTTYERSELSYNLTFLYPGENEYKEGAYKIQSLYLQDPKEIDLIINSYNASTTGNQSYSIYYDNLPQTLEYKNNKITIEDIELNEDSTRIIIKEDDSKDRKYIKSDIRIIVSGNEDRITEGKIENINMTYIYDADNLDSEARDGKGKVAKEGEWSYNHYHYVFKQELIIDKEKFEWRNLEVDNKGEFLRPELIYIAGLHYKEFPNSKINIKLK